jgi:co-chaperonin GroES (HSP10)
VKSDQIYCKAGPKWNFLKSPINLITGGRRPMAVAAGNTVLFGKYAGTEIKINGEERLVMRESDILGILDA